LGGALILALLLATPLTARAWYWQASVGLGHDAPFRGTVSSGAQDAAVEYESQPGQRFVWSEGRDLYWTQDDINGLQDDIYCRDNYCGTFPSWYETASTFHAFDKNTNNPNALHYNGWGASNLPGYSVESPHADEVRVFITDPYSMSPCWMSTKTAGGDN
jgi:hypothetical protein